MHYYHLTGKIFNIKGNVEKFDEQYKEKIANKRFTLHGAQATSSVALTVNFKEDKTFSCLVSIPEEFYYDMGFRSIDGLTNWVDDVTEDLFHDMIVTCIYENLDLSLTDINNIDFDVKITFVS